MCIILYDLTYAQNTDDCNDIIIIYDDNIIITIIIIIVVLHNTYGQILLSS